VVIGSEYDFSMLFGGKTYVKRLEKGISGCSLRSEQIQNNLQPIPGMLFLVPLPIFPEK